MFFHGLSLPVRLFPHRALPWKQKTNLTLAGSGALWWEPEPADPVKFGRGQPDTTIFVSTDETEADWRALRLSRKVAKDLSISFARMSWLRIHSDVRVAASVRARNCLCMSAMLCEKGTCAELFNCPPLVPLSEILHPLNASRYLACLQPGNPRTVHQPPVLL